MILAQTTLPGGLDWNSPGVKQLLAWAVLIYVGARLLEFLLKQAGVSIVKALGLLKRTWREEMEAKVQTVAQATATIAEPTNPNALLQPKQLKDVLKIAAGGGGDVQPALVVPTPETINKNFGDVT